MTLEIVSKEPGRDAKPVRSQCGSCGKKLQPGTESVTFRAHHARCIDRALARVRDFG
ncbi:MAG TPA: hypothetical protein VFF73_28220 [Planctomycetota bacterium]|jgi:hypothetical protein|nr:hypothetical protein [Planctomycetota bacterium]